MKYKRLGCNYRDEKCEDCGVKDNPDLCERNRFKNGATIEYQEPKDYDNWFKRLSKKWKKELFQIVAVEDDEYM